MIVTKTNEDTAHAEEQPRVAEKTSQCAGYTEVSLIHWFRYTAKPKVLHLAL